MRIRLNEYERQQQQPPTVQPQVQPADDLLSPTHVALSPASNDNDIHSDTMQGEDSLSNHMEPVERARYSETPALDHPGVPNPLVPVQPAYIHDNAGSLRYLGHSSTWSFSRQVLHMAHQSPHSSHSFEPSMHVEGEVYRVDAGNSPTFSSADTAGIPSADIALYHLQNVKFRTRPLYHLFDEADFTFNLHHFYESPLAFAQARPLWYIHYLLIMAFGKAFIAQPQAANGLAGLTLFERALRLLPDVTYLVRDRVESTEILCCIALYLESIDHRSAAHVYIGQAVRLAQSHGLHTNMQASAVGNHLVHRGRRIWWTVYALDRKLSCSMGIPISIRDEDITTPLSLADDTDFIANGLAIHVRICQLLGNVISTVYSNDGKLNQTCITSAQTVLRGVAGLANELAVFSRRCFGDVSRVAARLDLGYHQCIILASRPFLYYLLKQRLESSSLSRPFPLSSTTKGLVQVCIDSAVQTIAILSRLREHDLLDTFLPFDLESAFSAAFVLLMASSVHPKLLPQHNWLNTVMEVFDSIVLKGNMLASLRKAEVEELAQILRALDRGRPSLADKSASSIVMPADAQLSWTPASGNMSLPSLGDPFFDEWNADDGFSGAQIMDLANALDIGVLDNI
ncbi:hypothetical protein W97_09334 [Coniosporium apollinis CBS 100218]|uniref:Xylanolytic transcriptional activator regulatory domain-containing protein n=1 Tax=Coniosporium apollinis (strain CBS 100218) TaxID=1168221 RepID=R7Z7H8_CONA1|nr:uncharacterized protein W97_09334 [Coniosporium apollinis CBS 100218]EON70068.1 hypothetical protein W97_09334 [Coniosporium apollinis CBS 100218]